MTRNTPGHSTPGTPGPLTASPPSPDTDASPFASMSPQHKATMDAPSLAQKGGPLCSSAFDARTVRYEDQTLFVRVSGAPGQQGRYQIETYTRQGLPYATATIVMSLSSREMPLRPDETLLSTEGLNPGLLGALISAGIIEDTGRDVRYLHQRYRVCRVLPEPQNRADEKRKP